MAEESYRLGFVYFDQMMPLETVYIAVIVVVLVIIVLAVVIGVLVYLRHAKKLRKERERTMMRGFELIERKNST